MEVQSRNAAWFNLAPGDSVTLALRREDGYTRGSLLTSLVAVDNEDTNDTVVVVVVIVPEEYPPRQCSTRAKNPDTSG